MIILETNKLDYVLSEEYISLCVANRKVNDYKQLPKVLDIYKELINEYEGFPLMMSDQQFYETKITFPKGNYYEIAWDTLRARQIIEEEKIPIRTLDVEYLKNCIDVKNINRSNLKDALENDEPIIVISYPILNQEHAHIVIDGNHRAYSRHLNGVKGVAGYILEPPQHLWAMLSPLFQVLYLIHQGVVTIIDYMQGKVSAEELSAIINSTDCYIHASDKFTDYLLSGQ